MTPNDQPTTGRAMLCPDELQRLRNAMPQYELPIEPARIVRRRHMRLDIRGCIANRDFGWFTNDDGTPASEREALGFLLDHVAQGHLYLPMGDCDNFDFQTGCLGHVMVPTPAETREAVEAALKRHEL